MNTLKSSILTVLVIVTMTLAINISQAKALTLRFAYMAPLGTINHGVALKFKEHVEKLSGGEIKVDLFPAGQLGNLPQLFGQLKKGAIDIFKTDVVVVSMVGGGKGLAVLFAPYLFRDQDHFKKFCESPIFKGMMGELEKENGIKWIGLFGDRSPRGVSTRNKMVLVPDDLKGQKLRTPRVSIINKILTGWGASVAVVAVPELYSSLKQKVVDGQDNGIDAVDGFKLYEVQKYFTATDHVRSSEGLWMNQQKWDSLSPTHQEMIIEAAEVARAWVNEKLREKTFIWFDRVREHGMTIVMPPLKPWIDASGKVIEEFDGKAWPKGLYKKIQNIK